MALSTLAASQSSQKRSLTKSLSGDQSDHRVCAWQDDRSFNHLFGPQQQRLRHSQPERLRGLHIDGQLEPRRLFEWQVGWHDSAENLVDVRRGPRLRAKSAWNR